MDLISLLQAEVRCLVPGLPLSILVTSFAGCFCADTSVSQRQLTHCNHRTRPLHSGSRLQFSVRLAFIATVGRLSPAISRAGGRCVHWGANFDRRDLVEFTEYLTAFAAGTLLNVMIENFRGGHASTYPRPGFGGGTFSRSSFDESKNIVA